MTNEAILINKCCGVDSEVSLLQYLDPNLGMKINEEKKNGLIGIYKDIYLPFEEAFSQYQKDQNIEPLLYVIKYQCSGRFLAKMGAKNITNLCVDIDENQCNSIIKELDLCVLNKESKVVLNNVKNYISSPIFQAFKGENLNPRQLVYDLQGQNHQINEYVEKEFLGDKDNSLDNY